MNVRLEDDEPDFNHGHAPKPQPKNDRSAGYAPERTDIRNAIDKLIRAAWEWGATDEVDGVRWGQTGDSFNECKALEVTGAKTGLIELLAPLVDAAPISGERAADIERLTIERCARACEKRAEVRFEESGTTEPDTNASYYSGRCKDEYTTRDEEDEDCAAAIRSLPLKAVPAVSGERVREACAKIVDEWAKGQWGTVATQYAYLADKIRALPLAPQPWVPTHRHADGGEYRFIEVCKIKMIDGIWHSGVLYETKDGQKCSTHMTRWLDRFEEIK